MSFFGSIVDKIVHYAGTVLAPGAEAASPAQAASPPPAEAAPAAAEVPAAPASPQAALQAVDVGAVLSGLAARRDGDLNWQTSIVDLLKLLELDSSLQARKALAAELDVHAGADGSAEQNVALHKAVVEKLEQNGGTVPASMKG